MKAVNVINIVFIVCRAARTFALSTTFSSFSPPVQLVDEALKAANDGCSDEMLELEAVAALLTGSARKKSNSRRSAENKCAKMINKQ